MAPKYITDLEILLSYACNECCNCSSKEKSMPLMRHADDRIIMITLMPQYIRNSSLLDELP